ncbi:MAG: hypothetical protein KBS52_06925 [Clostridiales bacterium]|nr:hypothetical protein [Candidatus Equinaster intestinalis]
MLKALVKKQFTETFRSYFVNNKTGKSRSKGGIFGMFALFAFTMLTLCMVFFGLSSTMGMLLTVPGYEWLYFSLIGIISLLFGTFGSVFNTFASLYLAKDNELLLSMPIPQSKILFSRMTTVFGLSFLYGGVVWLPAVIYYIIFAASNGILNPLAVIFSVLLLFIIPFFVTAITCALGWVIAAISVRIKNKSFLTVLISLLFFGAYYFVCIRSSSIITSVLNNSTAFGNAIKTWLNLAYQLGSAASGNIGSMLIFTAVTAAVFGLCFFILSKTFAKILTQKSGDKKANVKKPAKASAHGSKNALLLREFKRFASSPNYMLNCGLGLVLILIFTVAAIIKRNALFAALAEMAGEGTDLTKYIIIVIAFVFVSILSIGGIASPSVALEGKRIWIIKSLPVSTADILIAKERLHIIPNAVVAVPCSIALAIAMQGDAFTAVALAAFIFAFVRFSAIVCLLFGLKNPNLSWVSETTVIKQDINILVSMLVNWLSGVALCAGFFLLKNRIGVSDYFCLAFAATTIIGSLLKKLLLTKGVESFDNL